ncbi:histidine phosphatase family protein [Clostridium hydrogeniformans]|uniref:histidine phosphatase family protein n=1 Tax=Clostridium hydrogeniformans TaxID=349933 RepID=UPI000483C022|nr:histidine phosphatase family protein [Clostridium hydrogeniformans]
MRIYIVRHGHSTWNEEGRLQGVKDTDLHHKGFDQAHILGKRLESSSISKIYCSPLKRAFHTGEIINKYLNVPIIKDQSLIEMNFGILEGNTKDQSKTLHSEFFTYWEKHRFSTVIPNGESYEMLFNRSFQALETIVKKNNEDILLISHGSFIRALICKIMDIDLDKSYKLSFDNCGISVLEHINNRFIIKTINDIGHFF